MANILGNDWGKKKPGITLTREEELALGKLSQPAKKTTAKAVRPKLQENNAPTAAQHLGGGGIGQTYEPKESLPYDPPPQIKPPSAGISSAPLAEPQPQGNKIPPTLYQGTGQTPLLTNVRNPNMSGGNFIGTGSDRVDLIARKPAWGDIAKTGFAGGGVQQQPQPGIAEALPIGSPAAQPDAQRSAADFLGDLNLDSGAGMLGMAYATGAANRDARRFKLQSDDISGREKLAIDAPVKAAQTDAYNAEAEASRAKVSPGYLTAQADKDVSEKRIKMIEFMGGYRESMMGKIMEGLEGRADLTQEQKVELAGRLAEQETNKMMAANGLLSGAQETQPQPVDMKQVVSQYAEIQKNIEARVASGQISAADGEAEYKKATAAYNKIKETSTKGSK